ncbi:MAG: hypothetical protein A2499_08060 [Stygiobacter sp. RIFOXYC12_FULL_38_8]|nr:MAG: hypothetical protein A2279_11805 [Stygiobacter sp. RIFOXYA12_FULL_38_9]OGV07303.1 MAG: hypothetical protein A2299_04585 [Stygiobacter sp. RIFOXYB2_FULL_37_11]OGV11956.1 MAG: hypothetical protein A2237_05800 [Stygiobacter sp. RIFOXYA2_FULL_38_8]OGV15796.1 MAG: hypothetical protein A2440_01970 [Stygiobacter sp. RIFOXYC2_FULL_38_25]OGV28333.1 MAG: hypothetical protein A2499_08060 [Stygiobacter sp. RIFOXYC12_FULL_38_8]OGV80910.1 MAG: hypothetical protein A2X65_07020 [Stygiobacter sp. GWF2_
MYSTNSLTYSGYSSSGVGGSASIAASGNDDVNRTFSSQNSGTVYFSFLVNAASVSTTAGDYNVHLGSTSTHYARVYFKKGSASGKFVVGISKSTETELYTSTEYNVGTTYLVVICYKFNTGSGTDDEVKLWINPDLSGPEPVSDLTQTSITADVSSLSAISLRQVTSTMIVDGIRVATSWSQAPLPVQLTSFTASNVNNGVQLNWQTATEVNNYGFEVERQPIPNPSQREGNSSWTKIGFVNGHGNSNSPKSYSFIDNLLLAHDLNRLQYRLKQIDFDGKFEYSNIVEVNVEVPAAFVLHQNSPNPFNPTTEIKFALPKNSNVELSIYNLLGEIVQRLANGMMNAGEHKVMFDASNLSSGVYIYKLTTDNYFSTRKMVLLK